MDKLMILTLLNLPQIGRKTVHKVLNAGFNIYSNADILALLQKIKSSNKKSDFIYNEELINTAKEKAEFVLNECQKSSIFIVGRQDVLFPERLRHIPESPFLIFVKGNINILSNNKVVAVIGTRKPTKYGENAARRLSEVFTGNEFIIVSGLADGCDTAAHKACLDAEGKTVAVMPCGLNKVYPAKNKALAQRILENEGCLISEYMPNESPRPNYFVDRDRLQSGLSIGVAVSEITIDGGTMHTAKYCLEQERILSCIVPPERYKEDFYFKGNIKLLNNNRTVAIYDEKSLYKFIELLNQKSLE